MAQLLVLARARDVPLFQNIQTGSGAHPASYSMGTGVPSLVVKQSGSENDHLLPSSANIKNVWSYTSTPNIGIHGMYWKKFSFFTCVILMEYDYSSFTVDVLYPIMQQWPRQPIIATEGEKRGQSCLLFPPSKLWLAKLPQTFLHNQHIIPHHITLASTWTN